MKNLYLALTSLLALSTAAHADDWMGRLPDNAPVCVVSIPGTHDTATGQGFPSSVSEIGERWARTQELTLQEQWAAGIRAFDLRPSTRSDGYLGLNHGIVQTSLDFDDALDILADSLEAHPTEFVVIHLRHESEGDNGDSDFETLLHASLARMQERGCLSDFRRNLTVSDMRGKMLFLFRDSYTTAPLGGIMTNWKGYIDWSAQTTGMITGTGSDIYATTSLYMQDYSDTHEDGAIDDELDAIETMLDYSTSHYHYNEYRNVWIYNFASAYSLCETLFSSDVSLADGYRDNATYTNKAIVEYLAETSGPTGIILADYVGVESTTGSYYTDSIFSTYGQQLIDAIIDNNFKYLEERDLTNDLTDSLGCYDASFGSSTWTVTSGITCNAGSQHWSNDPSDSYFEQSSSEWSSSSAWTETMTQTLDVENGYYTLSAMGRSSASATVTLDVNGTSYTFPADGDTGGTVDIYGTEWESLSAGVAAGTTFANSNKGRGWNKGSISVLVTDGKLTITATLASAGVQYQWASIDDFRLTFDGGYDASSLKETLAAEVAEAQEALSGPNVGDAAFQVSAATVEAVNAVIASCTALIADEDATLDDLTEAIALIQSTVDALYDGELNQPAEGQLFNITMQADGFRYDGRPITFYEGTNTTSGNYGLTLNTEADVNCGQAFAFVPVDSVTNGYNISFTDVEGETRYLCTGKVYSTSASNIRTTLEPANALVVVVNANTGTDGVWKLYNTLAETNIGTSSSANISSNETYCTFSLTEAELVSVTPTTVNGWATVCVPFLTEVPEGWTAYSCEDYTDSILTLTEVDTLQASTPYIVKCAAEATLTGAGTYYSKYTTLTAGLLTGVLEDTDVESGTYVLTTEPLGAAAFMPAAQDTTQAAYTAVLTATEGDLYYLSADDIVDAISAVEDDTDDDADAALYDLSGRRVPRAVKGIYIKKGNKVLK